MMAEAADYPFGMKGNCEDACDREAVSVEFASQRMLADTTAVSGKEWVPLVHAVGRVLAETLVAPRAVPGHTNSAVDGYAVRGVDLPKSGAAELYIIGSAYAGGPYRGNPVAAREVVKIMTGAVMPEGLDTVVMEEHVHVLGGDRIGIDDRHSAGQNVRQVGEDLRAGDAILEAGRWLTPADVGLIASIGLPEVPVRRRLRVSVLSTGNELRALGEPLTHGSVYDSNRYLLAAALQRMGVEVIDLGIVCDAPDGLREQLRLAAAHTDVIITTGGVSSGEADWIRSVVNELGRIDIWKVAMKPGRPLTFGTLDEAAFFGLPGNPVAVLVAFYWLVKPVLEKRMGVRDRPIIPLIDAMTEAPLRKKPGRMEFQRGILQQTQDGRYRVRTTGPQGSGILRSMSIGNGLIVLAEPMGNMEAGACVPVLPFAAIF